MAIRDEQHFAFDATGFVSQRLDDRVRRDHLEGRFTISQPAAVEHAKTRCREGMLGTTKPCKPNPVPNRDVWQSFRRAKRASPP